MPSLIRFAETSRGIVKNLFALSVLYKGQIKQNIETIEDVAGKAGSFAGKAVRVGKNAASMVAAC